MITDEALAQAYARTGDRGALERLVARRFPEACRLAERALGDPAAAEDVAQEACLRLLDGLQAYDPRRPFGPWFRTIVANAVRDAARAGKSRKTRERAVGSRLPAAVEPTGEAALAAGELLAEVQTLPMDVRLPIVLHFYHGLGHAEVAEALGCPVGTASSRLRRGIESLRSRLAPAAFAAAAATALADEARAQEADMAADHARGLARLRGEAPPASPGDAPPLRALEALRAARDAALAAGRRAALRGLGTAAFAALVGVATFQLLWPARPPAVDDGKGGFARAVASAAAADDKGGDAIEGLRRAGLLPPEGAAEERPAPPPARPRAPEPAPSMAPARAAAPTETAKAPPPPEEDPLLARALALEADARRLRLRLDDELAEIPREPEIFFPSEEGALKALAAAEKALLDAQRAAGSTPARPEGAPPTVIASRDAHAVRALERDAVALSAELSRATLALCGDALPAAVRLVCEQELRPLDAPFVPDDGPWRVTYPTDGRAATFDAALLGYRAARSDPKQAAASLHERLLGRNESSAIAAIRTLTTAQALFREGDKDRNGVLDYARSLRDLQDGGLVDDTLGRGEWRGYRLTIHHASQFEWRGAADPIERGVTGGRSFFVDESGVIRFSTTGPAAAESRPIGG